LRDSFHGRAAVILLQLRSTQFSHSTWPALSAIEPFPNRYLLQKKSRFLDSASESLRSNLQNYIWSSLHPHQVSRGILLQNHLCATKLSSSSHPGPVYFLTEHLLLCLGLFALWIHHNRYRPGSTLPLDWRGWLVEFGRHDVDDLRYVRNTGSHLYL